MGSLFRPSYRDKRSGQTKRLKRWYGKYRDADGAIQKVPLSPNKTAAQVMLNALLAQVERARAGLVARTAVHATTPLAGHLSAWAADLAAGGPTDKHVRQTVGWVGKVIDGTRAVFAADLTAEASRRFLADLRLDRPAAALDPGKEWYTRDELAAVRGVKP